jgi:hypothetical protein
MAIRSKPSAIPPCGGAPARKRLEQEAEPRLRVGVVDAEQREDLRLLRGVADADAPAAELGAVEHHVVRPGPRPPRSRRQMPHVVGLRRGERVVHRGERASLRVALEHREVDHPEKLERPRRDQVSRPRDLLPHAVEGGARHVVRPGDDDREVTVGEPERVGGVRAQELGRRPRAPSRRA